MAKRLAVMFEKKDASADQHQSQASADEIKSNEKEDVAQQPQSQNPSKNAPLQKPAGPPKPIEDKAKQAASVKEEASTNDGD